MAKQKFKAEVDKLLKLIIHSLYSHSEIFLRELVSNASDALDKMTFLSLTESRFKQEAFNGRIDIWLDSEAKTLTVSDNGIGMDEADLNENLGKIAHSGTKAFLERLTGDAKKDSNLIGQFGVGFYSVFMVADKVKVISRKAGEERAFAWESDGETGYTVSDAQRDTHGTTIVCYLNKDGAEYAQQGRVNNIIEKYSNHIAFPIFLHYKEQPYTPEGEEPKPAQEIEKQANSAQALWKKSKALLKVEDYNEFYHNLSHDQEDPLLYMHTNAEGSLEYTTLFYIPAQAPFDLFQADYKPGVKLYVKRVFITDDDKELLPVYLRFIRGVIDSEDLPLNVSREILQQNRILANIKAASVKKILGEIKKLSENDSEKFKRFVENYNRLMKEGLYSDFPNRDELFEIVRFKSTAGDDWTGLAAYKDRMPAEQKAVYYLCGESEALVKSSPLLHAYKKKGFEVLLLSDEMDEFVMPMLSQYKDLPFKPINRADADDDFKDEKADNADEAIKPVAGKLQKALGERVKEVRLSNRLDDAPAVIVSSADGMSMQMNRMFKMMGQEAPEAKPILEINPKHALVQALAALEDEQEIAEYASILLDGAYLAEGVMPKEPNKFADLLFKKLNKPA